MRKSQDQQLWKPVEYRTLRSSVIGIIGFGEIGSEVARVASLGLFVQDARTIHYSHSSFFFRIWNACNFP